MEEPAFDAPIKRDNVAVLAALILIVLLTIHLSQDIVFGYEPSGLINPIAMTIAAFWFYSTFVLAGRRAGYLLLLIGSFAAAVVPLIHMSGSGVRDEVVRSSGGLFFLWVLLALGVSAPFSVLLSIHGMWRVRRSILGFVVWCCMPTVLLGALIGYVVYTRH
jgi:hypothetical protein